MKKRITSVLLAIILLFSAGSETVYALQPNAYQQAAEFSDVVLPTGYVPLKFYETNETLSAEDLENGEISARGSAIYNNKWDCYSTNYYYNLLSENEQIFWDRLDNVCLKHLTGTNTARQITKYPQMYWTDAAVYSGITLAEAKNVAYMFKISNPQYFFLGNSMLYSAGETGGYFYFEIFSDFADGNDRQAAVKKMERAIAECMPKINAQPTALAKEKTAHDIVCGKVTYDMNFSMNAVNPNQNKFNQVAYSVFCTDTSVCAGYAQAFALLMNGAGIDCAAVTSADHEWNIVRLDGAWYNVDCTWDDTLGEGMKQTAAYEYFNRSAAQYANDKDSHRRNSHMAEAYLTSYLPSLIYDSGATRTDIGTLHSPSGMVQTPKITIANGKVSISAANGADIYYTTDKTAPSVSATKSKRYKGVFNLPSNAVVTAVAVSNGWNDSAQATASAEKDDVSLKKSYKVTLQANGGYFDKKSEKKKDKTIKSGKAIGKLASPKRKNYAFLGWYTSKSGGKKVTETTKVKGKMTLYAHWAKVKAKKASLNSLESKTSGAFTAKVKKISSANGYQLRYSLKKNMKSAKTKTFSASSATVKKLKKGKKYYVQVRMYQKESVSGKKKYGPWSKTKVIKIK